MNKRVIVFVGIAILVLLAVAHLWGPSLAPLGQQPLTVLSNADLHEFAAAFDGDPDVLRMVLLLSPT